MKLKFYIPIICGIIALQVSCNHTRPSYDADLVRADSLKYTDRQKGLEILMSIDAARLKGERDRAYYALLISESRYRNNVPVRNASLIKVAVDYYTKSNEQELAVRSLISASCIYRELGDLDLSISTIQKAADRADGITDKRLLYMLYYHWGMIMQEEKPFDKSIEYFSKAKQYAEELNDTAFVIHALREIGFSHMLKSDYKTGQRYLQESLQLANKIHNAILIAPLNLFLAQIENTMGNYKDALKYANNTQKYILVLDKPDRLYCLKGYIFLNINKLDSAELYIHRGENCNFIYARAVTQKQLSQLCEKRGNLKAALQHSRNYAELVDSIREFETDKKVMRLQQRYDYSKIEAERNRLEIASQRQQIYILVLALVIVVAGGVFYIVISHIHRRNRESRTALERIVRDTQKLLNDRTEKLQRMETETEAMVQANASEKQLLWQENQRLRQQITSHQEIVKKIERLKGMDTAQKMRKNKPLTDGDFAELVEAVDLCYPGFSDRLRQRHPGLEDTDIVMCCLLKLGVTNSDLSMLLNISIDTFRKRKYRLKKDKMGVDDKQFKALEDYLNSPLFSPEATE